MCTGAQFLAAYPTLHGGSSGPSLTAMLLTPPPPFDVAKSFGPKSPRYSKFPTLSQKKQRKSEVVSSVLGGAQVGVVAKLILG